MIAKRKKTATEKPNAQDFAIEAARLAANTRCKDVVVLDVRSVSPITEFLVIATGTSARQMRSVMDEIEELGEPRGFKALSRAVEKSENWLLIDFVDVVIHAFSDEGRSYYDLAGLWGDAPQVEWKA